MTTLVLSLATTSYGAEVREPSTSEYQRRVVHRTVNFPKIDLNFRNLFGVDLGPGL